MFFNHQLCLTSTPITTATETTTTVSVSISTVEKEVQILKPIVDDLGTLVSGPAQSILNSYPKSKFGLQNRSFNSSYLAKHDWLEYSIALDAIFCYACRIFSDGRTQYENLSGSRGAKKNKACKLEAHSFTQFHLTCMAKWKAHQNTQITGSVHAQLSTQHKLLVESNRKYMSTLIDKAFLLASQGLALRGHDESSNSLNQVPPTTQVI
ncbi:zinc finger MYM-type protein 1-like [Aphis gossypii]|uniref:zinc finger MYM-type protein 1-like n=1 Tax=Aphis gossypii TaxID=80765 RepID=UPI00215988BB|nr:zinc finger MYM-type protein 1-like [Aphis gossypii]